MLLRAGNGTIICHRRHDSDDFEREFILPNILELYRTVDVDQDIVLTVRCMNGLRNGGKESQISS